MDMYALANEWHVMNHLTAFLIGMPRLFAMALVAPFLGTGVLEGQVWLVLVLGLYLPMHPVVLAELTPAVTLSYDINIALGGRLACLFLKETLIGLVLGYLAGLPFWAVGSAGSFMDNQRGASQAEGTEILTGKSISPMGGVLFQVLVYLFYAGGAFMTFLGLVYATYAIWPVTQLLPVPNATVPLFIAEKVAWLMATVLLIAAPISVACLLVDIALGLINRFSPQLNAYVLAMPIKSGLASFLLCFYLGLFINNSSHIFRYIDEFLYTFSHLLRI